MMSDTTQSSSCANRWLCKIQLSCSALTLTLPAISRICVESPELELI